MSRFPQRARTMAWTLMITLIVPILAACGGTSAPPAASPAASAPAASAPAASASASPAASASAEPSASPAASATTAAEASAQPSPINDKIFIAGYNQSPDTLFSLETTSGMLNEVGVGLGREIGGFYCYDNLSYDYQSRYCFEEFPTLENGGAVTETVQVDPSQISEENPIVVDGTLITDTAAAQEAGLEIPSELDQLTLTFKLNKELRWEDGTPVTAADVKEAFRIKKDPTLQLPVRYTTDRTLSVEATDDYTVVQKYAPGYLDFDYYLTFVGFMPAHKYAGQTIEQIRDQESTHPWSFGPYMVKEHIPGESTTLVSNPYFTPQPKIGTVVFKYVADQEQLIAQLESGQIDYAGTVGLTLAQAPQLDDMEAAQKVTAQYVPSTTWEHIDFGIVRGDDQPSFFDDVRARQAVAYAINRKQIIDNVLFGKTTVMNTYVPSDHPSYPGDSELEPYNYDPEKAKQLLDEAGWAVGADGIREKDGRKFSFTFYTTQGNATRQATSEIIQQNLKDVGIEIKLEFVPGPEVLFKEGAEGILDSRRFDMALYAWGSGVDPSHTLYRSDFIPSPENNYDGQNNPGYSNPEFDAAAKAAASELNKEKRRALDKVPLVIVNKELPTFPLYQRVNVGAFNPAVTGIQLDPTSDRDLFNIEQIDINK
jgi:peptide/nickel transport system substrate-binding protein